MSLRALALAGAVFLAPAGVAHAGPPATREAALAQLARGDAAERRQASAWLGEHGEMTDAPALVQALRDPDGMVRALAESALWQVWSRSGDPEVEALFATGIEQMQQHASRAAIETFTKIIEKKPEFAEGWNKRATLYYLIGEYDRSLRDCDEVMKRNPNHFGALAGYGQIYLQLGRPERALEYFQRALDVNPNMTQVETVVEQLKAFLIQKRRETI